MGTRRSQTSQSGTMTRALAVLLGFGMLAQLAVATTTTEQWEISISKIREEVKRSNFHWLTPKEYHALDKTHNTKPYMFTFMWSGCPVCIGALEHLANKEDPVWLGEISSKFNAVLIWDRAGEEYVQPYMPANVDYVPRSIFAHPNGTMRHDLKSRNAGPDNPFFYMAREMLFEMTQILKGYEVLQAGRYPSDLEADLPS